MSDEQPDRDVRLWSGYTCETCGWFELRPQTRDRGRIYCPHCERLGRGKAFTMKRVKVVPLDAVRAALEGGYAPQNPTAHHPADWVDQWFGEGGNIVREHVPVEPHG